MTSAEFNWDGNGWLKGNAGQTGFYRVNYEQQRWDQLANQINTDHKVRYSTFSLTMFKRLMLLPGPLVFRYLLMIETDVTQLHLWQVFKDTDRAGLIDDAFNLAR